MNTWVRKRGEHGDHKVKCLSQDWTLEKAVGGVWAPRVRGRAGTFSNCWGVQVTDNTLVSFPSVEAPGHGPGEGHTEMKSPASWARPRPPESNVHPLTQVQSYRHCSQGQRRPSASLSREKDLEGTDLG